MKHDKSVEYEEGWEAYWNNVPAINNPYMDKSMWEERSEWINGWLAAQAAEKYEQQEQLKQLEDDSE